MNMAGELLATGLKPQKIYDDLYVRPWNVVKFASAVQASMKMIDNVAFYLMPKD
jgi:hypothetical protein